MTMGHYDYSYELNQALWDNFFFSGISDTDSGQSFPLPNSRLQLLEDDLSDLLNEKRAAANLLLDGAFNINSTSVAAWESAIGAMRDIETLGIQPSDSNLRHNFARFNAPAFDTPGENPTLLKKDELAAGFRNLSDAQVAALAEAIVNQIRQRSSTPDAYIREYPFLSLSQFINRALHASQLDSNGYEGAKVYKGNKGVEFAFMGALQAAIDAAIVNGSSTGTKSGLWMNSEKFPLYREATADAAIVDRPLAEGMPGFLMQSDLLAKLGSFLQARSDTFTIRSYGSFVGAFSDAEGSRAYYQIVVQRTPEYVDTDDKAYNAPSRSTNIHFGRKYVIISQGWVTPDEI
jgi:hypothetical protein